MSATLGSPLAAILPLLGFEPAYRVYQGEDPFGSAFVPLYLCPADPSVNGAYLATGPQLSNYAMNAQAFAGIGVIPSTFSDGLSQTILFAERYALAANYEGCQDLLCEGGAFAI